MVVSNKWKIYCETEDKWVYEWIETGDPPLDYCPVSGTHTVTSGSQAIDVVGSTAAEFIDRADSVGIESTTSTSPQTKATITTDSLPSATYKISWSFEIKSGDSSKEVAGKVDLDDTGDIFEYETKTIKYELITGFTFEELNGVHNIKIKYYVIDSTACYIRKARLDIWRVP
jgi:hypothetical protein